jgi:3-phosphoshikimate 1-carboxyvinyltransferase
LECGNSGTTMRIMCGVLAGAGIRARLVGDESLSRRPMRRVVEPLRLMGANIDGDFPPVTVNPAQLHGCDFSSPMSSAQVKSALLIAGLFAKGTTAYTEPQMSRDHTERMLEAAGCTIVRDKLKTTVEPGLPKRIEMRVPADISSAAFFLVGGALLGGPVTARDVGLNPTRTGLLDVLAQCGVKVNVTATATEQGEPVGDIAVEKPQSLSPFKINSELVPRLIDEIPVLAVLATQCEGLSEIRGAEELRYKESDRLAAIAEGLTAMGATVEVLEDGMCILGPTSLNGATIDAKYDHRIAMAFAIAGLLGEGDTTIRGAETIETSFPGFESEVRRMANG